MKAGLLPLYIALYDEIDKRYRNRLEPFCSKIADMLEYRGIEIVRCPICTKKIDFEHAVSLFENEACDAIITLHLAYSPSLESSEALLNTRLPIIVCDTTETYDFSDRQSPGEIMYCHGIHGVMDMCNMLRKGKKIYAIAAGHYKNSGILDRVAGYVRAASCAKSLFGSKVGSIGGFFDGMGDFRVSDRDMLDNFGVLAVYPEKGEIASISNEVTHEEIEAEKLRNAKDFDITGKIDYEIYENSVRADLTLRKWIENKNLSAFTVNFLNIGELPTMPFNGICRMMESGIGYAGEGDILTASFCGALLHGYKNTSFIETFCPDWKNNAIFISHMGEINYSVTDKSKKPTFCEREFRYADCKNPVAAKAAYMPGKAVFANVYQDENGFNMLLSDTVMLKETTNNFKEEVRGWMKLAKPLNEVLEKISRCGATHHSILIYGAETSEISFFARCAGINPVMI